MRPEQFAGVGLLVIGLFLLYSGFQETEKVTNIIHESVTGNFTLTTTYYLIFGTLSTVSGIGLLSISQFIPTD